MLSSIHDPVIQTRTIILWTELFPKKRREKIQGENFNLSSSTVVFPQIIQELQDFFEYSVFYSVSTRNPATPSNSPYRINSSTRNTTTTRLIPCKAPSSNCSPCLQASYTAEQGSRLPYSIPRPYSTSRLPVILGGRNSILGGRQHPRSPYSSSQAHSYKNSTRRNRIHSKGSSIVCPCNTKVSVFQFAYSYFRIILQEN